MAKTGRNDPCPCGSGRKYKKCCLAKAWTPAGREESIKSGLVQKILRFVKEDLPGTLNEAYACFWDDFDPAEHLDDHTLALADINFREWLVHDWTPEKEGFRTLIDLYTESNGELRPEEKEILLRMNDAVISLYEVQEVFEGEGLVLKDLLLGGEYEVREKAATASLSKWDIFATRLMRLDGNIIMTGCVYPYPLHDKERLTGLLKKGLDDYRKEFPGGTMREFLKRYGDIFNYYWYENIRTPFRPVLTTTSGEPLLFCTAVFDFSDREGVRDELGKVWELEKEDDEDVFAWLDKRREGGTATVLGTVRIGETSLRLECNSRERLERGKVLLLSRLGGMIMHRADTFQDPYQALKEAPPAPRRSRIPKEEEQEIYTELMQRFYEKWLNKEIPALGGETPLEAVKKPWGKKKVAELLKRIENAEEHKKKRGEPWIDTSWLWERLGIER